MHLRKYSESLPILKEASGYGTVGTEDIQEIHLYLGTCYTELHEEIAAKEEFLSVVAFNLRNNSESEARYRVAALYFVDGGFAQAKHQVESIHHTYEQQIPNVPRKYVYERVPSSASTLATGGNAWRYTQVAENCPPETPA